MQGYAGEISGACGMRVFAGLRGTSSCGLSKISLADRSHIWLLMEVQYTVTILKKALKDIKKVPDRIQRKFIFTARDCPLDLFRYCRSAGIYGISPLLKAISCTSLGARRMSIMNPLI